MAQTMFAKILATHFAGGSEASGGEAMLRIDQVMLGDAVASLAYVTLESFGVERIRTEIAACYVDQIVISDDGRVADDHAYLLAASRRLGLFFSPAGNGIGPALHMERFARPGATIAGTHRETIGLGALGALALPVGALDAALVLAGEPLPLAIPKVGRLTLHGSLPEWVSGTDAALELLRRHGVRGRAGAVLEVVGPGVLALPIAERALLATMLLELGVVAVLFPADERLEQWLTTRGRGDVYTALAPDEDAKYDFADELDLSALEPMIAKPQSPANVVPVRFAEATQIGQVVLGGMATAQERDLARMVTMLRHRKIEPGVTFDWNPATRAVVAGLAETGALSTLLAAGVRVHEPAFGGTAGIGQAPQPGRPSLRTTQQNFPGGSGTRDDRVFLCSTATAVMSAVRGTISRPSAAGGDPLRAEDVPPLPTTDGASAFVPPLPARPRSSEPPASRSGRAPDPPIARAASIKPLPALDMLPKRGELRVLLKIPDDVPVHEIVPEGLRGASHGSNVAALGDLAFERVDATYVKRAKVARDQIGHAIVAGHRFGYGSNRDHAALALRQLGLRVVIAKSYGEHFRRSLLNAGVLPLTFFDDGDYYPIEPGELLVFDDLRAALASGPELTIRRKASSTFLTRSGLTAREFAIIVAGGIPNWFQKTVNPSAPPPR